jgi:hypothetical protein
LLDLIFRLVITSTRDELRGRTAHIFATDKLVTTDGLTVRLQRHVVKSLKLIAVKFPH